MAVHIFTALLLHLKTQQVFLTAQATLKRNELICLQGKTKVHCSKESTGPTVSSRMGEPNRLHASEKVVSPTRVTLPAEARQLASPSCLAIPSCLTHLM